MEQKFRLNEFKALYKTWKTGVVWLDHLLLGLLLYLERKLIDNRVKNELDEAIKEWETLQGGLAPTHSVEPVSSVYTESPSETSTRLPNMRITSAWYDDTISERSEPPEGI